MYEIVRLHNAEENVRRQQQGHGNAIVSFVDHGYRHVAVRTTIHWSKSWIFFPDFLLDFLKATLGRDWGVREKPRGLHPVFRWLEKFQAFNERLRSEGKPRTGMMGFIACWLHLAYALYLIAHNDQLPKPLLKRLREPLYFMPAYYETIVGAALAVAGFELSCAETKASSIPTPEFRAKSKTTDTIYEVEAKRKESWKAATADVSSPDFLRELDAYVRDQVYRASKKKLKDPIYWFELSIPTVKTEADWRAIAVKVGDILRGAEANMTVDGQPIQSAFVVLTNHTFLANEDLDGEASFAVLETLKIDDYPFGRAMEIEAALQAWDKYRDIFRMMEGWKIARTVPTAFDGTPPELLSADGVPQRTMKIGDIVDANDLQGRAVKAKVTEICSMGDKAVVALTADGRSWLAEMPLSTGEAAAAKRFTDAIFGKENASRGLSEDHPFDLYEFLLRAHTNLTQEQVVRFFAENPTASQYKELPLKEARVRIAREHTKWMWIKKAQQDQS